MVSGNDLGEDHNSYRKGRGQGSDHEMLLDE
jgi:hypothetical protein